MPEALSLLKEIILIQQRLQYGVMTISAGIRHSFDNPSTIRKPNGSIQTDLEIMATVPANSTETKILEIVTRKQVAVLFERYFGISLEREPFSAQPINHIKDPFGHITAIGNIRPTDDVRIILASLHEILAIASSAPRSASPASAA